METSWFLMGIELLLLNSLEINKASQNLREKSKLLNLEGSLKEQRKISCKEEFARFTLRVHVEISLDQVMIQTLYWQ